MDASEFIKKNNLKIKSRIKLRVDGTDFEGILLPSQDFLQIKLDNGYNVGFNPELIKSLEIIATPEEKIKAKQAQLEQDASLPQIVILHTGGTIASKVDYGTGGVSPSFDASEIVSLFPELQKVARISSVFVSNIFSEDMRFENYAIIAREIAALLKDKPKGIIVTHGTDTMHYTASALAFMFENLPVPVILVGSQRSSDRPSTDAMLNLVNAARFIAKTDFAGVAICMHSGLDSNACHILPATKTRKMHSSRRDAFKAVNSRPIAKISEDRLEYFGSYPKYTGGELKLYAKFEEKVGLLKARPNISPEEISFFQDKAYKGLIIEGTGLGHIGITEAKNKDNLKALQSLISSGCIVCMTTQCIFGEVNPNVYSTGRELKKAGVIFLHDMLAETAYIKLAWLLGNFGKEKALELMEKNLRGEISERSILEPLPSE